MSDDKPLGCFGFALVVGLVLLLALGLSCTMKSDEQQIRDWAKQNGYIEVISVDRPGFFESSPWWFRDEDARIYKATLKNRREERELKWVRFQYFGMDVK